MLLYPLESARQSCSGQFEGKCRSFAFARFDPDSPAHRRHEPARDEETEPSAALTEPEFRTRATVELAKDLILVALRDADPLVCNADLDRVVLSLDADCHRPALRVLERVVEQDRAHLPELVAVGVGRERLLGQFDDELMAVGRCVLCVLHDLIDDAADVGRCDHDLEIAGVEPGDVQ